MKKLCLGLIFLLPLNILFAQGIKSFKLNNGLSVFVWEDHSQPDVFGMVTVRAGAINDPEDYTGLAHYLEHVMFKGTDRIGTLDWEKEKVLYNDIIALYDKQAEATDPIVKSELGTKINELTVEASRLSNSNEFSILIEGMGGTQLNAGTSYDFTLYHNQFPASEIEKWLEIYSARLINPVFRSFQTELETVYEEYNRSADNESRAVSQCLLENAFEGTPYSRSVIGKPEHLKNPRLSALINFYEKWYVPENMSLILVGNIKTEEILPIINRKFGRLASKPLPNEVPFTNKVVKGRVERSAKVGLYPSLFIVYDAQPSGHADEIPLSIATSLLSNSGQTGLLDKLYIDGDLMSVSASPISFKDVGKIVVQAVPYYDAAQRRFSSFKTTEKLLTGEIKKLQQGEISDWLVEAIKVDICKSYDLALESNESRADMLSEIFITKNDINDLINFKEKVMAVSIDDIKRVAKQYFSDNFLVININEGKAPKGEKLPKPNYKPLENNSDLKSAYATWFQSIKTNKPVAEYEDINNTQIRNINTLSKLHHRENRENEIFSLEIKYGVGTIEMPRLNMATQLMNNAGIMAQLKAQEFKEELSKYHAQAFYSCDENYLTIRLTGVDTYLAEACNLLTRQILLPAFDEKQFDNLKGSAIQQRMFEKKSLQIVSSAAQQYLVYQKKSDYIDRIKESEIFDLSVSGLTGEFQKATHYAANIYYYGTLPIDSAYSILSNNLPLVANEQASKSPQQTPFATYDENVIYFVPDVDAQQSKIYFLVNGPSYTIENEPYFDILNDYLSGGFGSIILEEIREKNSMAYSTYGVYVKPLKTNNNTVFVGEIGTQSDNVTKALKLYIGILKDMPKKINRVDNVKQNRLLRLVSEKPNNRSVNQIYDRYKQFGYTNNPAIYKQSVFEKITPEEVMNFYQTTLKDKPISIIIVGNPKQINLKEIESYGKIVRLSKDKLFSSDK